MRLQNPHVDLVVSGVNQVDRSSQDCVKFSAKMVCIPFTLKELLLNSSQGDNLGLHVIYSGTVGAAREAACKVALPVSPSSIELAAIIADP